MHTSWIDSSAAEILQNVDKNKLYKKQMYVLLSHNNKNLKNLSLEELYKKILNNGNLDEISDFQDDNLINKLLEDVDTFGFNNNQVGFDWIVFLRKQILKKHYLNFFITVKNTILFNLRNPEEVTERMDYLELNKQQQTNLILYSYCDKDFDYGAFKKFDKDLFVGISKDENNTVLDNRIHTYTFKTAVDTVVSALWHSKILRNDLFDVLRKYSMSPAGSCYCREYQSTLATLFLLQTIEFDDCDKLFCNLDPESKDENPLEVIKKVKKFFIYTHDNADKINLVYKEIFTDIDSLQFDTTKHPAVRENYYYSAEMSYDDNNDDINNGIMRALMNNRFIIYTLHNIKNENYKYIGLSNLRAIDNDKILYNVIDEDTEQNRAYILNMYQRIDKIQESKDDYVNSGYVSEEDIINVKNSNIGGIHQAVEIQEEEEKMNGNIRFKNKENEKTRIKNKIKNKIRKHRQSKIINMAVYESNNINNNNFEIEFVSFQPPKNNEPKSNIQNYEELKSDEKFSVNKFNKNDGNEEFKKEKSIEKFNKEKSSEKFNKEKSSEKFNKEKSDEEFKNYERFSNNRHSNNIFSKNRFSEDDSDGESKKNYEKFNKDKSDDDESYDNRSNNKNRYSNKKSNNYEKFNKDKSGDYQ